MLPNQRVQFYGQVASYMKIIANQNNSVNAGVPNKISSDINDYYIRREAADFVRYLHCKQSDFEVWICMPGLQRPVIPIEFLPPPSKMAHHECSTFRPSNPEVSKESILKKNCFHQPSRKYFVPPLKANLDTPYLFEFNPPPSSKESEEYAECIAKLSLAAVEINTKRNLNPVGGLPISLLKFEQTDLNRLCEICFEFLSRKPPIWFAPRYRLGSNLPMRGVPAFKFHEFELFERYFRRRIIKSLEDLQEQDLPERYQKSLRSKWERLSDHQFRKARYLLLSERLDILCHPPRK